MDINSALTQTKDAMGKAVAHVRHEFETVHTGKANPSMVENVMVEAYGTTSRLRDIAAITTPDSSTIRIQPWDKGILKDVEKAILAANIGITPNNDGNVIRLIFPELTEERRKSLVKDLTANSENAKIVLRNARRDAIDALKKLEKSSEITEDDLKDFTADVDKRLAAQIEDIEKLTRDKEQEILSV